VEYQQASQKMLSTSTPTSVTWTTVARPTASHAVLAQVLCMSWINDLICTLSNKNITPASSGTTTDEVEYSTLSPEQKLEADMRIAEAEWVRFTSKPIISNPEELSHFDMLCHWQVSGINISTVSYLIMHNVRTDPPPMHYENYARQAMSHNCDIGDSVTHWRRSFNEIKKYVSIWDCFAVKMSMHLKEAQNSQSCWGKSSDEEALLCLMQAFSRHSQGLRTKLGAIWWGKKGRKHSKSAHVFYFMVFSSLWAIKCLSMPIFRFKHGGHSSAPPIFNLKMLSDSAYLYPWPYALFNMRL